MLFLLLLFNGCGLFEARTPNPPDDNDNIFVPPTSADIVIENLFNAINNKNVDNYCNCFLDSFLFIPSAEANLNYPGLFDFWQKINERKYFSSITNTLGQSNSIKFELTNIQYETQSSDSVILFADYSINIELSDMFDTKYSGILSFTIIPIQNGIWTISRWIDFQNEDATDKTFSELKALFSN